MIFGIPQRGPVVLAMIKDTNTGKIAVLTCPFCGKIHAYYAKEGWYESGCSDHGQRKEYYITFCDAVSSVYLIFDTGSEYVKIGKAKNVRKRLVALQTTPTPLILLYTLPCDSQQEAYQLEKQLQKMFRDLKVEKEWFSWSSRIEMEFLRLGAHSHQPEIDRESPTSKTKAEPNKAVRDLRQRLAASRKRK
ncbi:hypothetical protein LCGC14_1605220 [marine sediment metagenome]|uniref:Uncharacterized protein n=1 Tax=marine sediment metagenome TaxID=412755 RepID=A0A0F9I9Y5_9ZZZZ